MCIFHDLRAILGYDVITVEWESEGVDTCESGSYTSQARELWCFAISELMADWRANDTEVHYMPLHSPC